MGRCVVLIDNEATLLWLLNYLPILVVLPRGMKIGVYNDATGNSIAAVNKDTREKLAVTCKCNYSSELRILSIIIKLLWLYICMII